MDRSYVLMTDDCCDLPPEYYIEHDIPVLNVTYIFYGKAYRGTEMSYREFYDRLRQGEMPTTAQVTVNQASAMMEKFLQRGKDILYFAFSSGLSGTYESGMVADRDLSEKYPERKIRVIDSLCASLGQGLMLHKLVKMRDAGKSMDELADWAEANKLHLAHIVTVEDLMHLHRGGRISKASAVMGGMLGIKPMIHMNNEGKLITIGKVRGRKASLEAIVDIMAKAVGNTPNDEFFVCHSDCYEEAEYVAKLASKRFGINDYRIHYIGPVIGSHTGPGTIALFMMAEHR